MRITRHAAVLSGAVLLILAGCSEPAPTPPMVLPPTLTGNVTPIAPPTPSPGSYEITISGWEFVPFRVTVPTGATVTWHNNDVIDHTVTSPEGLFDEALNPGGGSFSYIFTRSGTFSFYCKIHEGNTNENGSVVVK